MTVKPIWNGRFPTLPKEYSFELSESHKLQPDYFAVNAQQREALKQLGNLTELGRIGEDPNLSYSSSLKGAENAIQLFQMHVEDSDMKHFALLPDWHRIVLRETNVSNVGFKHLSNQRKLQSLDISETLVTSLNPIKGLSHLRKLCCDNLGGLTDRKAVALKNFCELTFLDLNNTSVGDATAKNIKGLTDLKKLTLSFTKISNDGMKYLASLSKLEMLALNDTEISDEGLQYLHGMKQLRLLAVGDTQVTEKGRKAIKKAIPKLKVVDDHVIY